MADRLINKRGRNIAITHPKDGPVIDQTQPWDAGANPPSPPQAATTKAIFIKYDAEDVDGINIKAQDFKLIFTATGIPFDISSRDIVTDQVYGSMSIIDVGLVQPGTVKVLYTLQVRKG